MTDRRSKQAQVSEIASSLQAEGSALIQLAALYEHGVASPQDMIDGCDAVAEVLAIYKAKIRELR